MQISKAFGLALLVGILALGVRLPRLSSFMTVDEENWMLRSAGFYHKLFRDGDTGGAFMTTHPGATTMWIAGAGITAQEARLGFDVDTSNLIYFRKTTTLPVAVAVSVLIGIATLFLARLFGVFPGVIAGVLLALEPYLVGMSQITHLDMLLALFMLNALLAFLLAKRWPLLLIAGVFAGLAMATKLLPALWLFVFFGLVLVWQYRRRLLEVIRRLSFIFGVAMLTFWLVWPALWFTSDLGRSFEKDIPYVVQDAHVDVGESEEPVSPASFYARTLLGRTTPFVLILSIGALIAAVRYTVQERKVSSILWLTLHAVGFLVFITFAAKKADRYALPALVVLPVVTGWALSAALKIRNPKSEIRRNVEFRNLNFEFVSSFVLRHSKLIFAAIFLLLLGQIWLWVPHSIAYNSPLFPNIRPLSQQGWGEGLEEAAAWLNQHPLAEELYIASWYPGVMQTYFHGKTFSLSSRSDSRVSYVVLYRNMFGRAPDTVASDVIDEYRGMQPDHVVSIHGTPYAWIYATPSTEIYKQHAGELTGNLTVGQLVPISQDSWQAIEIGMANFSNRRNTQDVVLHVGEVTGPSTGSGFSWREIRTTRVNAREIEDGAFHRFEFEPIQGTSGKTFYVFLDSPSSRAGDAVTVRFINKDILSGEMVRNGVVLPGRDVAYRIPK